MVEGTVVVLPCAEQALVRGVFLSASYPSIDVAPVDGPEATLASRVCAAINAAAPAAPLVIVAVGLSARLLPSVALAQRAAHRRVAQYVLVDPVLPEATDSWPDARVIVFADDAGPLPVLRGWDVSPLALAAQWHPDPV